MTIIANFCQYSFALKKDENCILYYTILMYFIYLYFIFKQIHINTVHTLYEYKAHVDEINLNDILMCIHTYIHIQYIVIFKIFIQLVSKIPSSNIF